MHRQTIDNAIDCKVSKSVVQVKNMNKKICTIMKTILERILIESEMLDREQEEFEAYKAQQKVSDMDAELRELDAMSEDEACEAYNTNSKAEARQGIIEYYQQIA